VAPKVILDQNSQVPIQSKQTVTAGIDRPQEEAAPQQQAQVPPQGEPSSVEA
jgi:hypothetical protein